MIYKNFELYNIAELIPFEDGFKMCRVTSDVRAAMSEQGQRMACNTAGAEFRFVLNSGKAEITLRTATPGASTTALLYFGGVQSGWQTLSHTITNTPTTITLENPPQPEKIKRISDASGYTFDTKVIRLVLESSQLVLLDAKGDVRPPLPEETPSRRFMMYGSSITHGSLACSANLTYLAQLGTRFDCDFYSFGFAGSCMLEKEVADYISTQGCERNPREWDFAVLELGVNAIGLECEEFASRVDYLLDAMLAKNPGKKLFVIGIYYIINDLTGENAKFEAFREIVRRACVTRMPEHPELFHIDGRKLLSSARGLSADLVHPNVEGVREIAVKLGNWIEANL